jgi:NAD(P)-dependent dehydrogenase (short-subunit alcohol dehydrogenase family)
MQNYFSTGERIFVYGRVKSVRPRSMDHPETENIDAGEQENIHLRRVVPVYPLTEGLAQRWMRALIFQAIREHAAAFDHPAEPWSETCRGSQLFQHLQFPEKPEDAEHARRQLALAALVGFQRESHRRRQLLYAHADSHSCRGDNRFVRPFLKQLAFSLTEAQTRVLREIRHDLAGPHPMRRLLQGDVGSGKTVVAACCALMVIDAAEERDARETLAAIEAEGRRGLSIAGDVTDPDSCRAAVERTVEALGHLDVLVNNAAYQEHVEDLEKLSVEHWDRTFRTNVYGYFHMVKAALPHLREGAAIVNCGSITGLEGSKALIDYSATKGAIHALTKSLAQNLLPRGIRVNCVAPGPVWTPLNPSDLDAQDAAHFGEDTPLGRPAQPEEVAPAFVFFASNVDSSYVTGEILTLLGGETRAG